MDAAPGHTPGHTPAAIYWHLNRIYQKQSISRQVDRMRLVLSLAELGWGRHAAKVSAPMRVGQRAGVAEGQANGPLGVSRSESAAASGQRWSPRFPPSTQ